jgi:hypothetical protein
MRAVERLRKLYEEKAKNGLIDVRFDLSPMAREMTMEEIAEEILAFEEAKGEKLYPLDFGDLRWKE